MVSKDLKSWAETVAVDPSEVLALPEVARAAVKGKAGVNPKVIVMNPSLSTSYGALNHEELKGKNWSALFKDSKGAIRKAMSDGTFVAAAKIDKIEGGKVEKWQSSAGTQIEAKLVAIEDDETFVFEMANGRTIRTTTAQLSAESVQRAKSLVKE